MVLAVGTRLQDFTTGSWALFQNPDTAHHRPQRAALRCGKHRALPLVGDAKAGLEALDAALGGWRAPARLDATAAAEQGATGRDGRRGYTAPTNAALPSDAQVIGAVQRARRAVATSWSAPPAACRANCTSCGSAGAPGGYHLEYGYSCMGYEIAGGLGVKMARPDARGRS